MKALNLVCHWTDFLKTSACCKLLVQPISNFMKIRHSFHLPKLGHERTEGRHDFHLRLHFFCF